MMYTMLSMINNIAHRRAQNSFFECATIYRVAFKCTRIYEITKLSKIFIPCEFTYTAARFIFSLSKNRYGNGERVNVSSSP